MTDARSAGLNVFREMLPGVLPDDVSSLAAPVLAHRLLPTVEATMTGRSPASVLDGILATVPVPAGNAG